MIVIDGIENFIHSAVFDVEINPQVMQWRRLSEIFICLIKSDKETLFLVVERQGVTTTKVVV